MLGRCAREHDRVGPRLVRLVRDAVEARQIEQVVGQGRDDAVEVARRHRVEQAIEVAEPRQRLAHERRSRPGSCVLVMTSSPPSLARRSTACPAVGGGSSFQSFERVATAGGAAMRVLICGGGVIGASIAYFLSRGGCRGGRHRAHRRGLRRVGQVRRVPGARLVRRLAARGARAAQLRAAWRARRRARWRLGLSPARGAEHRRRRRGAGRPDRPVPAAGLGRARGAAPATARHRQDHRPGRSRRRSREA